MYDISVGWTHIYVFLAAQVPIHLPLLFWLSHLKYKGELHNLIHFTSAFMACERSQRPKFHAKAAPESSELMPSA